MNIAWKWHLYGRLQVQSLRWTWSIKYTCIYMTYAIIRSTRSNSACQWWNKLHENVMGCWKLSWPFIILITRNYFIKVIGEHTQIVISCLNGKRTWFITCPQSRRWCQRHGSCSLNAITIVTQKRFSWECNPSLICLRDYTRWKWPHWRRDAI